MTTLLKTVAYIIFGMLSAIGLLSVTIGFVAVVFNCAYQKHRDNEDEQEISLITGI